MNPETRQITQQIIDDMNSKGWIYMGDWLFFYCDKIYDLSAADLEQLDRIVEQDAFIVAQIHYQDY